MLHGFCVKTSFSASVKVSLKWTMFENDCLYLAMKPVLKVKGFMSFMHLVVTFGIIKSMETIVLLITLVGCIVSHSEFNLSGNKVVRPN